nr:L-iditol 2-dehydrogenase [uncultured Cohaesibacter sp.]
MRLKDKVALITGSARGIGFGFAKAYAKEGAKVVIADINIERATKAAAEIGDAAIAIKMDVTSQESIDDAVKTTVEKLGKIDILINNAGLFCAGPVIDIKREDFLRVYDINVNGVFFTMQAVAKHMIERGKGGKIINMASQAGRRGEALVAPYCSTKAAVISLTQSAGLDLIKYGINVNAIAPGVVDGEHWDGVDAFFAQNEHKEVGQKKVEVGKAVPFGRMATPEDLCGMAIFLATSEADYIVSQTYNVDGGNWMS